MGISIKAIFGFGIVLKYEQAPWLEENFEEFDNDFLEWVSQQIERSPTGEIFDASVEERKEFADTLPVKFIQAFNSEERYLLLTKYCWLLEQPKPMNVGLNLDNFDTELVKAKDFCKQIGVNNFESSAQWLLGLLFD